MKKHGVYFLQKRGMLGWDTVEQSQSAAVLRSSLIREMDAAGEVELRVVAGDYSDTDGRWSYRQVFYADQGSMGLSLDESGEDLTADDEGLEAPVASPSWPPPGAYDHGDDEDDDQDQDDSWLSDTPDKTDEAPEPEEIERQLENLIDDQDGKERWSFYDEMDDDDDDDGPIVLHGSGKRGDEDVDDDGPVSLHVPSSHKDDDDEFDLGFAMPPEIPEGRRRRRGIGRLVIWLILVLLLSAVATGAVLLILKPHVVAPFLKQYQLEVPVDRIMGPIRGLLGGDDHSGMSSGESGGDTVMPPISGQKMTFTGVAPALIGKWSPGDCERTYIDFFGAGYLVTVNGEADAAINDVTETIEDDYHFYLRRSPALIEHFQKIDRDQIQLAGTTDEHGFQQKGVQVLTRCPA